VNDVNNPKVAWLPVFEPEVEHALFLIGHRNLLGTGLGQIVLAGLVALATYDHADHVIRALWLGYLVLAGFGYFLLIRIFKTEVSESGPNVSGVKRWYRYRRTLQVISGIGWGFSCLLMQPGLGAHNVVVMTAFAGVVGYSAAGNSANDFLGFVFGAAIILLTFMWRLPAIFGAEASTVMVMCVLYVTSLTMVLRNTHNSLRKSIRLQLDNEALAANSAAQARRAEQANRDKSEFLAAASHDLRQPVHALLLLIEAYRQQVPAAMNHPLMKHMATAGRSINNLFNALMELSRLESGTEKLTMTEFDLRETLLDVLERSQPEAQAKGLHLRSKFASSLVCMRVCTDQLLLKRILGNLLSNAVRYTPHGGVLLALRRSHADSNVLFGDGLWIEVWDTGIGIAQDDQARIFNPYVQMANRERDRSKGLGLGLSIVRHACELIGLKVSVHSVPQRGTRFRIVLPGSLIVQRHVNRDVLNPATSHANSVVQGSAWLAGRRVLLIDDDPLVQLAMQAMLKVWRLDVRAATRGDESVLDACGADWEPECVLCDFRLPGTMNGIELLDFLQDKFPKSIGVLLTGEMLQTVQQDAEDAGYMLLSKPLDSAVLAFTLGALLERRHEERIP
jgi:signal transduction histidine kinase/ActR/RegA family two-component response regulator